MIISAGFFARLSPFALVGAILLFPVGCISENHQPAAIAQSPAFDIPPQKLAQDVKEIVSSPPISLSYDDEQDGAIVTGWQPFRGDLHIVRYWYERTRYHITVVPDFNDPAHRARIQVSDETQQRPEESGLNQQAQQWSSAPDLHRPDRSNALMQQIETQLALRH